MKLNFLLALMLITCLVKAEYNNTAVELEITFANGKIDTLYMEDGSTEYDSLIIGPYKIPGFEFNDTIRLLEDRQRVKIPWENYHYKKLIYGKVVKFLPSEIKSARLLSFESNSYATNIYSGVSTQDTSILKNKPLQLVGTGIELCSYDIFIYEETENVKRVLNKIKTFEKFLFDKGSGNENSDEEYDIFDFESKYNPELQSILNEFKEGEVVIFETCTC